MKWLFLLLLVIIWSCKGNFSAHLSYDQQGLYNLAREFVKEYRDTSDSLTRNRLLSDQEIKLQAHLRNVCKDSLQKMKVQLKTLEVSTSGIVQAEFTDENCRYFFHQTYASENEMKGDTIYQLLASLKRNTDVTLRFMCTGTVKVNGADLEGSKVLEIAVIPIAAETQAS